MSEFTTSGASITVAAVTVVGAYKLSVNEAMETHDVTDWDDWGSGRNRLAGHVDFAGSFNLRLQDSAALPEVSVTGAVSFASTVSGKVDRTGDILITGVNEDWENTGDVVVNFIGSGSVGRSVTVV